MPGLFGRIEKTLVSIANNKGVNILGVDDGFLVSAHRDAWDMARKASLAGDITTECKYKAESVKFCRPRTETATQQLVPHLQRVKPGVQTYHTMGASHLGFGILEGPITANALKKAGIPYVLLTTDDVKKYKSGSDQRAVIFCGMRKVSE